MFQTKITYVYDLQNIQNDFYFQKNFLIKIKYAIRIEIMKDINKQQLHI